MTPPRAFAFVQFEHPGRLGPGAGRYVVRRYAGDEVRQVLVFGDVTAPRRGPFGAGRRRRVRDAGRRPAPLAVEVTRATIVSVAPLAEPAAWLERAAADAETVAAAARLLNRALAAYRLGAADPYVADVAPARALAIRVGYGAGEEVADGRWTAARDIAPDGGKPRGRAGALLAPQERLAAILGGRDASPACEELALRARADLEQGREREAALGAEAALRLALAELSPWSGEPGMAARLDELAGHRAAVAAVAEAAVQGGLEAGERAIVEAAVARLEAACRARLAAAAL